MNWDDGRIFLALARTGQMLAAARQLGLNQATVSRRLATLENALDTQLVVRRPHGCVLTPEGATLRDRLERVEAEMIGVRASFKNTGTITGSVRVGAPDGFGTAFLAPRLSGLSELHPGLKIQLVPVPRSFSLSEREADIAILVGRPATGRLRVQKLTDYTLGLYASPDYLEKHGIPRSIEVLMETHRLVGHVEDLLYAPDLNYTRDIAPHWPARIEVSSAMGQIEAVAGSAGIGILHDYLATNSAALVRILPEIRITRAYWLAYHETLRGIPRIQATIDYLLETVAASRTIFALPE